MIHEFDLVFHMHLQWRLKACCSKTQQYPDFIIVGHEKHSFWFKQFANFKHGFNKRFGKHSQIIFFFRSEFSELSSFTETALTCFFFFQKCFHVVIKDEGTNHSYSSWSLSSSTISEGHPKWRHYKCFRHASGLFWHCFDTLFKFLSSFSLSCRFTN